jgi:hypothetical protein
MKIKTASIVIPALFALAGGVSAQDVTQTGEPSPLAPKLVIGAQPVHKVYTGGAHTYKRVVTDTNVQTTSATEFKDLEGAGPKGGAVVPVGPGRTALINVRFTAESRCNEDGGAGEVNWCEAKILIGGQNAEPNDEDFSDPYAFDATDDGTATFGDYEGHAMERHVCVKNVTNHTLKVPVQVQWRVTNHGNDSDAPQFWLDDWSLAIERADRCAPAIAID